MVGGARPAVTQSLPFPCSSQNGRSVSKRGVSCQFGPDVTKAFLEENQLDYIIRSHEVKNEGYEVAHGGRCVTVFSAPNYWCVLPHHLFSASTISLCEMISLFSPLPAAPSCLRPPLLPPSSVSHLLLISSPSAPVFAVTRWETKPPTSTSRAQTCGPSSTNSQQW